MERSKKNDMLYNTTYIQFRRKNAVIYTSSELALNKKAEMSELLRINNKGTYKGQISDTSKKLIRKKISVWFEAIESFNNLKHNVMNHYSIKPVFLTCTLSSTQFHSDKEIKQSILKPFLRILRENYKCDRYLWKAEKQQNGNIHFHIIIDVYIDKFVLQKVWNNCQDNLGYITEYERRTNLQNPPSTHIQVINNYENLSEYIEKYICKKEIGGNIEGAIWRASKKLLSLQYFEIPIDSSLEKEISNAEKYGQIKVVRKERYTIILPGIVTCENLIRSSHTSQYNSYLKLLQDFLFVDKVCENFTYYCKKTRYPILTGKEAAFRGLKDQFNKVVEFERQLEFPEIFVAEYLPNRTYFESFYRDR